MKFNKIAIFILLLIYSNSYAQHKHRESITPSKDTTAFLQTSNKTVDLNTKFNAILLAYIQLKNALVIDDANASSGAGKLIMKAIDAVNTKILTNQQELNWMLYSDKIYGDAEKIKASAEIKHQREHFISLSRNLFELAKAFKVNNWDLYYQYCPMANDGKGAYWLSDQSTIRNPYFGKKMLSCGSTKEILPALKE